MGAGLVLFSGGTVLLVTVTVQSIFMLIAAYRTRHATPIATRRFAMSGAWVCLLGSVALEAQIVYGLTLISELRETLASIGF